MCSGSLMIASGSVRRGYMELMQKLMQEKHRGYLPLQTHILAIKWYFFWNVFQSKSVKQQQLLWMVRLQICKYDTTLSPLNHIYRYLKAQLQLHWTLCWTWTVKVKSLTNWEAHSCQATATNHRAACGQKRQLYFCLFVGIGFVRLRGQLDQSEEFHH